MSEQDFINECEALLNTIEDRLDSHEIDVDFNRTGHVLEIEFEDDSVVVINGQVPMREIWLASPAGAWHFRKSDAGQWLNTRGDEPLADLLSDVISKQAGQQIQIKI